MNHVTKRPAGSPLAPPSGIVTFVFSDIEGSTRVLKRLGDRYPAVLERHREVLRTAWQTHNGYEVNTEGDSFFVAFPTTQDAVEACAQGQQLIESEPWPPEARVRVRMGIHCGLAAPHNGDYVALAVHQASRVINAAHGGQVILSEDAAADCPALPGLSFLPLGLYRLRDFEHPVRLVQVVSPGLQSSFPAVRALPAEGHNLVRQDNTFVGRSADAAALRAKLRPGRLVTVVGPGGVGKSRLATEVGIDIADEWSDGVWLVDLASIEDDAAVPEAIADVLGADASKSEPWAGLVTYLRPRSALLLLDSVESHVEICARLVPDLLRSCHGLGVLATSREPMRIRVEETLVLEPLAIAPLEGNGRGLAEPPAVSLFLDRALAARAGRSLPAEALTAVAGICRRLDGLPLAIEIAAARTAMMSPVQILAGLDDMFRILRSNDRSLPPRQRTFQALLDWSYRLLTVAERSALRRLAVLGSSFDIPAAEAAVGDDSLPSEDVAELVWGLVDRSLLRVDLGASDTRYRFFESVRQYGRRLLDESAETGAVAGRLGQWYLEQLGPPLREDRTWMGKVALERDNLIGLIPLLSPGHLVSAQQLACVLGRYFDASNAFRPGITALTRFATELTLASPCRVSLLSTLAHLHLRVGDVAGAEAALAQARALNEKPPPWDDAGLARTTGELAMRTGDWATAAAIAETALGTDISRKGRARMWNLLGLARTASGDLPRARDAFEAERSEVEATGEEALLAGPEGNLAEIALRLGDDAAAARHQARCLELALALGQSALVAYSLIVAARLAGSAKEWVLAARLHAKAGVMLEELGQRPYDEDLRSFEALGKSIHEHLGPDGFAAASAAGAVLDTLGGAEEARQVFSSYNSESPTLIQIHH